mmetsp:Transcript_48429/g.71772  ORF Transcript_48429/g.71772 Transcript_48429/m.71772 type:complete len:85 (+) Transcript_48429:77-331(+)
MQSHPSMIHDIIANQINCRQLQDMKSFTKTTSTISGNEKPMLPKLSLKQTPANLKIQSPPCLQRNKEHSGVLAPQELGYLYYHR